jgi:hypothetical protein
MKRERIKPFKIDVAEGVLRDLRRRLKQTKWPRSVPGQGWEAGTDVAYLRELIDYWLEDYDWRKQERALNRFAHFKAELDGIGVHFIHERGRGPNPFPLL